MSWRLVIAVILLSLPGYYTLSRHERGPAQPVAETNSISKEFVPDFNIDRIAEDGSLNPTEDATKKPPYKATHRPRTTDNPQANSQKNGTTTSSSKSRPTPQPLQQQQHDPNKKKDGKVVAMSMTDFYYVAVVAGCSVAGVIGIGVAGVCWYKLQKGAKMASDVDYPAYGITGPNKDRAPTTGDRKLAQSAQMYHYQHQKQQMIAMEKANGDMKHDASEDDSEEENDEGDYTVYECPGLAPTGEMEVKNPLFNDETPAPGSRDPSEK